MLTTQVREESKRLKPVVPAMPRVLPFLVWLAVCAAGLLAWRWLARGFSLTHPRFVTNDVSPVALVVAGAVGLISAARRRAAVESHAAVAGLALSFAVAALLLFGGAAAFGAAVATTAALPFAWSSRRAPRSAAVAGLLFAAVGAGAAWGLRAPDPSTRPLGTSPAGAGPAVRVEAPCGRLVLHVDPALHFDQAASGRFWSPFEPDDARAAIGPATAVVEVDAGVTHIDAARTLSAPVYAHLDHFARVDVLRAKRLSVRIATGAPAIDVLPSDYPAGRPVRFLAWSGATLFAYEASSAEKGPFRALAQAPLARGEPLQLELLDEGAPQCRLTLLDFTAQASTEPSPTAGWGLPQNGIELLASDGVPAQTLFVTLAATSIGRGFDTVGHAAGTYRNRIRVEP